MTFPEDVADFVVPDYDRVGLSGLLPGVARACGVTIPAAIGSLPIPETQRACVVLLDGVGAELLAEVAADTAVKIPFLRSLVASDPVAGLPAVLHSGAPTTTATAMGSLGTGLPPGQHGLLGYQVRDPQRGVLLNQLRWDPYTNPLQWQPHPTIFAFLAADGVAVTRIGEPSFDGSGLTVAAHRGGDFIGAKKFSDRVDATVSVLTEPGRAVVYLYWGAVDGAGHEFGWRSPQWRTALAEVDAELARLASSLPAGTLLAITADHGMVDVPHAVRFDIATQPNLRQGVGILGGEPRMVQLYCLAGQTAGVAARFQDAVGDRGVVVTRDEAIAAGWFGPVSSRVEGRLGDVLIAARSNAAVIDSAAASKKLLALIGHHGSLTAAEQLVPLLTLQA